MRTDRTGQFFPPGAALCLRLRVGVARVLDGFEDEVRPESEEQPEEQPSM